MTAYLSEFAGLEIVNGLLDFVANAHDRHLARGAQPEVAVVHQEIDTLGMRQCDDFGFWVGVQMIADVAQALQPLRGRVVDVVGHSVLRQCHGRPECRCAELHTAW